MTMSCKVRELDYVTVLDLTGRLSLGEAVAFGSGSGVILGETIRDLTRHGRKKILLNLAEVTYVDSSGIGQLMGALTSAYKNGAELKLLRPNEQLLNLMKLTKVDTLFDINDEEAAAVASFTRGGAAAG